MARRERIKAKFVWLLLSAVFFVTGGAPAYSLILEFWEVDPNHDQIKLSTELVARNRVPSIASDTKPSALWRKELCVSRLPFFVVRPFHSNYLEEFRDPMMQGLQPVPRFSPLVQYPGYRTLLALSEPCTTILPHR